MIVLTKEESQAITIVKVLCMFGVVYIHAAIKMYVDCPRGMTTYYDLLTRIIPCFAVPGFFMCSGFLFYKNYDGIKSYPRKAKGRFKSLVIPYLFWITLTLLVTWFIQDGLGLEKFFGAGKMKLIRDFTTLDCLRSYWDLRDGGPFLSTMWFLKDLIICVVLAPILYYALKTKYVCILTFIVIITLSIFGISVSTIAISSLLWFALGGSISIHSVNVFGWIKKQLWLFAILSIVLVSYKMTIYDENAPHSNLQSALGLIMTLTIFLTMLSLSMRITNARIGLNLITLGTPSYFIYLAHEPYMGYALQLLLKSIKHAPQLIQEIIIIAIPIVYPAIIILICLWIFKLLWRLCPRALSIVVGGKV